MKSILSGRRVLLRTVQREKRVAGGKATITKRRADLQEKRNPIGTRAVGMILPFSVRLQFSI
jgi:hypothetical protein